MREIDNDSGLLRALIGDGRPLLVLTAVMLFLSGAFAIFLWHLAPAFAGTALVAIRLLCELSGRRALDRPQL